MSQRKVVAFELLVIIPTLLVLAVLVIRDPAAFDDGFLIMWTVLIALVELLPVPAIRRGEGAMSSNRDWDFSIGFSCRRARLRHPYRTSE